MKNWKEEFANKFPILSGVKVTPRYDDDIEKSKILQMYWNELKKNLLDFIESLLAEQKKESYEEGFNEGKKLVCNGKCSFYNGNLTGYDSGCYVHNLSLKHHD